MKPPRAHAFGPVCVVLPFVFSALSLSAGETAEKTKDRAPMRVCLLTGFEPFGGLKVNPSWEIVKAYRGKTIAGYRIAAALLPVVYDEMAAPLRKAIERHRPEIVICLGVGKRSVCVERLARNGYHPKKPKDNKGRVPPRTRILPRGKDALPNELPTARIVQALKDAHIGASTSTNAGGYLCNECFYRIMHTPKRGAAKNIAARGFVHVPDFGMPNPLGGTFTRAKLEKAVRIIVEETVKSVKRKKSGRSRTVLGGK